MLSLKDLQELYNSYTSNGCLAAGISNLNNKYYSFCGNSTNENKYDIDIVNRVLGQDYVFCYFQPDGFTVLKSGLPASIYTDWETDFYDLLEFGKRHIMFDLVQPVFIKSAQKDYCLPLENRYFTCSEKKIIGHCMNNTAANECVEEICTTTRPCYQCLPVIKVVHYLSEDQSAIKDIRKIDLFPCKKTGHKLLIYTK